MSGLAASAPTSAKRGANEAPLTGRTPTVKYMILTFASQQQYQEMVGQPSAQPAWTQEDWAALGAFMEAFNRELAESGELVETRGLTGPVHARRLASKCGIPVVTDGPYAETAEVLAGYWIVECDSFDRATEIAARLAAVPAPAEIAAHAYADVRPIAESREELDV
jgi:hypothetical protein